MLDTYKSLETPESIDLELHLAGPVPRILAFAIDLGIRLAIQFAAAIGLFYFGNVGIAIWMIFMFLMEWFYPVFFEVFNNGQTPGKKAMHLRVILDSGTPVTWSASIIRNLLRFVDFLPFGYVFGLISMCITEDFKRLGDLTAGTVVVHNPQAVKASTTLLQNSHQKNPLPPPLALSVQEQKALLSFTERQHQFTPERQQELANHLASALQVSDQQAVDKIHRISSWLVGAR